MTFREFLTTYLRNIYESITTIGTGMWITFKTGFFERKVTLQYPSHDVLTGTHSDAEIYSRNKLYSFFEPFLGAGQRYKGPLNRTVSNRYRGLLGFDEPKCIGCLLCAQICPIDVITVTSAKIEGRKAKAPLTYRIDYAKCMFCGLCVEVCPTEAVIFTRQFEAATFDCSTLIRDFVSAEERNKRLQLAAQTRDRAARKNKEQGDVETGNL